MKYEYQHVTIEERTAVVVAYLSGQLNALTIPPVHTRLEQILTSGSKLLIEMSAVAFLSSAGLWMLYSLQRQFPDQGKLVLAGLSESVRTTLALVGFDSLLRSFDTESAALAYLESVERI